MRFPQRWQVPLRYVLIAVLVLWAVIFRSSPSYFWWLMTPAVLVVGAWAMVDIGPFWRREQPNWRDLALGIGSAGLLYGLFYLGKAASSFIFPFADQQVGAVYSLADHTPTWVIAVALALIIGPGEELFWRGFIQRRIEERFGVWPAFVMATAAYTLVHAVSGNLMLVGAAAVAGGFWGLIYAFQDRLTPLIISHVLWDIAVLLLWPIV